MMFDLFMDGGRSNHNYIARGMPAIWHGARGEAGRMWVGWLAVLSRHSLSSSGCRPLQQPSKLGSLNHSCFAQHQCTLLIASACEGPQSIHNPTNNYSVNAQPPAGAPCL